MDNLSYTTSTAISPTQFRLIKSLETARNRTSSVVSSHSEEQILVEELTNIKSRWEKSGNALSSSKVRHDLIIALYCVSQRPLSSISPQYNTQIPFHGSADSERDIGDEDLFGLKWALPGAVQLAGGGVGATLAFRRTGYRACNEIFTEDPHELKLLLINTIISDLNASESSPNAEARWAMGLRAAASPRLATPELVPAIAERVSDLYKSCRSSAIRRLALATLMTLLKLPSYGSILLLSATRSAVLSHITRPIPSFSKVENKVLSSSSPTKSTTLHSTFLKQSSISSTSSLSSTSPVRQSTYHRHEASLTREERVERDPHMLLVLVRAVSRNGILFPLSTEVQENKAILDWLLTLLRRLTSREWGDPKYDYHGVQCGWLAFAVLGEVELWVPNMDEAADMEVKNKVLTSVLDYLATILESVDIAFGLILASVSCISPLLSSPLLKSLNKPRRETVNQLLSLLSRYLQSKNSNLNVLVVKCLMKLPKALWTGEENSKSKTTQEQVGDQAQDETRNGLREAVETPLDAGNGWNEESWAKLMGFLDSRDIYLRKLTTQLLEQVDPNLTQLHVKRLCSSLSIHRQSPIRRDSTIERLLEVSSIIDKTPLAWSGRIAEIVNIVRTDPEITTSHQEGASSSATSGTTIDLQVDIHQQQEVLQALVLRTIDRYGEADKFVKAEFAALLMDDETWKTYLTSALLVAATAGGGATSATKRLAAAGVMGKFLAKSEDTAAPTMIELLQQPFMLSILRILSQMYIEQPSLEELDSSILLASSHATDSSRLLFALYFRCRRDPVAQSALIAAGQDRQSFTLPGFYSALEGHLDAVTASLSRSQRGSSITAGTSTPGGPSPAVKASRLVSPGALGTAGLSSSSPFFTPSSSSSAAEMMEEVRPLSISTSPNTNSGSKPLRYQAYESPSLAFRSSADGNSPSHSSSPLSTPSSTTAAVRRKGVSDPPRFSRQREIERERKERGGKGGQMAQSLMTPGALAMIGLEQELDGDEEDDDDDSDSESTGENNKGGNVRQSYGTGDRQKEEVEGSRSLTPVQSPSREDQMEKQEKGRQQQVQPAHLFSGFHPSPPYRTTRGRLIHDDNNNIGDDEVVSERSSRSRSETRSVPERADSPPADLLIELGALNPFHDNS